MPRLTHTFLSLRERAAMLGVRLTREEAASLARRTGRHEDIGVTRRRFLRFVRAREERHSEREAFLAAIEEPSEHSHGRHIIPITGIIGTASFAIGGTQVAGDAGMNVVGCMFVGCVSALGGSTLNSLMFGFARTGVPWVRNTLNLGVALSSSLLTFLMWPLVTEAMVQNRLQQIRESATSSMWPANWSPWPSSDDGTVTKKQFVAWLHQDKQAFDRLSRILGPKLPPRAFVTAEEIFDIIDEDKNGILSRRELGGLIKHEYDGSTLLYALDSAALASAAVTGCAAAVSRGLHPLVCSVAGVTMCFGGILRDLLCRRDVRLGSQSYAAATAAGTIVYVGLREACLLTSAPPALVSSLTLGVRASLCAAATLTVRVLDFQREEPLLPPMHGREYSRPLVSVQSAVSRPQHLSFQPKSLNAAHSAAELSLPPCV